MSCLFNSLSKFVSDDSYKIRTRICDYLSTNPILFDEIKASDAILWESGMSLETYVQRMRSPSVWGSALEIKCFVNIYKINVDVVNIRDIPNQRITMVNNTISFLNPENMITIRVSWNGSHYFC
jgi:hypothetical protein